MNVVHVDCGKSWRGGQLQVYLLHRELVRRAVHSIVLSLRGSELGDRCRQDGLPVVDLSGRRPWFALAPRVDRVLRAGTIVHAHDSKAAGLASLACLRHPELAWVCHRRLSYALGSGRLSRRKYRRVRRWIAVSKEVRRSLEAVGISSISCAVIPSALDVHAVRAAAEAAEPEAVRDALGFGADTPVVGIFGALVRQKGHDCLIAAAPGVVRAFPQTRFLVVGEGRLRQTLKDHVLEAGLEKYFHFLGFRYDVPALMRVCTVVAAPSLDGEGSPAAVKEAMALGRAVVASDLAAHREVLGEAGSFFPVADHEGLAQAVTGLLADTVQRRTQVSLAGSAVERFRPEIVTEATLAVYREAMTGMPVS